MMAAASAWAASIMRSSRTTFTSFSTLAPLWRFPRISPSRRSDKSYFASSKPSSVRSMAARRASDASDFDAESKNTCAGFSPRPTRPRSWWSCAKPKRSASATIMTVALGTSTPTSMTVVATSTCVSFARKRAMTSSFSAAFMRPCSSSTRQSANTVSCR